MNVLCSVKMANEPTWAQWDPVPLYSIARSFSRQCSLVCLTHWIALVAWTPSGWWGPRPKANTHTYRHTHTHTYTHIQHSTTLARCSRALSAADLTRGHILASERVWARVLQYKTSFGSRESRSREERGGYMHAEYIPHMPHIERSTQLAHMCERSLVPMISTRLRFPPFCRYPSPSQHNSLCRSINTRIIVQSGRVRRLTTR